MTPFILTAGPFAAGRLRVLSFRGREAVSRPFRFDILIAIDDAEHHDFEPELLAQAGALTMHVPGGELREVHGIVAAVEARDAFEQGRLVYRVRLVPRLWLLGKRKTSRIFQNKTVPEIVTAVLEAARIPHRWALVEKYAARTYCVQYQESDLAFVTRLLAEEGIFYVFEHGAEETVVFHDSAHLYAPIAGEPELAYRFEEGADGLVPKEHHVGRFALRRAVKHGAVLQREYDFRRPLLELRGEAKPSSAPPRAAAATEALPVEAELCRVYEHHGEDERPDVDGSSARTRLEQARRRALVTEGRSACRRLLPGARFDLVDHELEHVNRAYVVARVEHEGRVAEVAREGEPVYANTFTCAPADVPLRPRRHEHVLQQVVETAIVVGPPGEEIHTDEHGRVKVQFPWDLDGKRNEDSSCWVRVAQAWAGAGWGSLFIPRVGMEVLVAFLGGDTDRPVIVGALYNGTNATPFALPGKKTQSGIRTRSTPGGAGANELRFEDAAGREQVYVHAQRDLEEVVRNDHARTVGGQEAIRVGRDRTMDIAGDHVRQVQGNEVVSIGKNLVMHIAGRQIIHVDGAASEDDGPPANAGRAAEAAEGHGRGPAEGAAAPLGADEGGGSARGGGAGHAAPWKNSKDKAAELKITGGGIIDSPQGLELKGEGGEISIKGGVMTLKATTIVLDATTVQIKAGGEAKIEGHPIRLN